MPVPHSQWFLSSPDPCVPVMWPRLALHSAVPGIWNYKTQETAACRLDKLNLIGSTYPESATAMASLTQAWEYENSMFCTLPSLMLIITLWKGKSFPFVMWQTFLLNSYWVDIGLFKIRCTWDGHSLDSWISYSSLLKLSDNLSIAYLKYACFYLILSMFVCQISILM
jgi:hypothetical protein